LNILSSSINLIYSDTKEIIINLEQSLKEVKNEKQAENCSISLNFLSIPENSKKLLQADSEELEIIIRVYEQCCRIKSEDTVERINENQIGTVKLHPKEQATLTESSYKFIRSFSEQLIVQYCALSE
jgi:hypothetical protein